MSTPTNFENKRVFDGLVEASGGVDSNSDSSLLDQNQLAFLGNMSLRTDFPNTRPPFIQNSHIFNTSQTQANYTGIFQGACFYTAVDQTQNSLIVSIGGHLFQIFVAQNFLTKEITPSVAEVVTADFVVPAPASQVTINVTGEQPFSVSQVLLIDSGNYTVNTVLSDQLVVTYNSGAANPSVVASTPITDSLGNQIYFYSPNPATADFVYLYQAENYVIGLCENQATIIFDGSSTRLSSQGNQELPSSYVGTYAWGRNWLAQVDGDHFVASDLVGDLSGTAQNAYRDAILKMTENNLLNGGGAFSTPANLGPITAMSVLSQLDSSLGIGPVLVGTLNSIFSVQAPVDRTTWQNLTYPIQSVAVQGAGPTGPRALVPINSDAWFRALDGVRSMMAARRDFNSFNSNTPNSLEMSQVFDFDDPSLLFYSSIAAFDNRIFFTASPFRVAQGVAHRGLVVLNRDAISSINKTGPPIWEGLWTGLNVFQPVTGTTEGVTHCYLFVLNNNGGVDLWETIPESEDGVYDVAKDNSGTTNVIPNGAHYSNPVATYNIKSLLVDGQQYTITFGANDKFLLNGQQIINSPGVGQSVLFTADFSGSIILNGVPHTTVVTATVTYPSPSLTSTSIFQWLETRTMSFGDPFQLKKLIMADLNLDQIKDQIVVNIYWRPDQYPLWTLWTTFNMCASVSQCNFSGCDSGQAVMWKEGKALYGARIRIPRPPEVYNLVNNTFMDRGNEFQFRIEIIGGARVRRFRLSALQEQSQQEGSCVGSTVCRTLTGCLPGFYNYDAYAGYFGNLPFTVNEAQALPIDGSPYVLKIWDAGLGRYQYVRVVNDQLQITDT